MKPKKRKVEFIGDKFFRGQWCTDSETGEEVLMCLDTNKEVYRKPFLPKVSIVDFVGDVLFALFVLLAVSVVVYGTVIRI